MGLGGALMVFNLRHKGHLGKDMDTVMDQAKERGSSAMEVLPITLMFDIFSDFISDIVNIIISWPHEPTITDTMATWFHTTWYARFLLSITGGFAA